MKSEILKLLREAKDYVSGQELCDRFSVSRTAIWKVINQLKEEGYDIEAVRNKGYRMIDSPDVLNKEAIESHVGSKIFGRQVVCFDEVDSTNIQAKVLAEQGCDHGVLVAANQQVSGKGRRGRSWESPKGTTISMSLVLRPTFAPKQAPMLTLVMAYSVAKAMQQYRVNEAEVQTANVEAGVQTANVEARVQVAKNEAEAQVGIKWPNDIVIGGKKVCGILTEMSTEIDYINYVVIGVGVNANMETFAAEISEVATSLKLEWQEGREEYGIIRARLMGLILEEFEVQYERFCEAGDLSYLVDEYNQLLVNRNKVVKVLEPNKEYEAVAIGIDEQGELLVRRPEGEIERVYAGEVSVRGIYGYV